MPRKSQQINHKESRQQTALRILIGIIVSVLIYTFIIKGFTDMLIGGVIAGGSIRNSNKDSFIKGSISGFVSYLIVYFPQIPYLPLIFSSEVGIILGAIGIILGAAIFGGIGGLIGKYTSK